MFYISTTMPATKPTPTASLSSSVKAHVGEILRARPSHLPPAYVGAVNVKGEVQLTAATSSSVPIHADSVFWAASCTKVITGIACGQLLERGVLHLDAPVSTILPELEQFDRITETGEIVKDAGQITLRMLLTHTAGFGYHMAHNKLAAWAVDNQDKFDDTWLHLPKVARSGERFQYGTSIDWAGRVVEAATGLKLGAYFQEHIFAPLGVRDATFNIKSRPDMLRRLVPMSVYEPAGGSYSQPPGATPFAEDPPYHYGGAGLFTTPQHFLKLLVPLINAGTGANGVPLLKPETVQIMFADHLSMMGISEGILEKSDAPLPGLALNGVQLSSPQKPQAQGLSFAVSQRRFANGRPKGTASWFGLAHTKWFAAPGKIALVVFQQILPFGDPSFYELVENVERCVWEDLESDGCDCGPFALGLLETSWPLQ